MPQYKLYYFNARARGESIRMIFVAGGVQYEDIRLGMQGAEWPEFKSKTPCGFMPVLDVDGTMISQTSAVARYAGKVAGLDAKNDLDRARADMVVACVDDSFKTAFGATYVFGTETAKAAAKKKWEDEEKTKTMDMFERFLNENGSGFFVGDEMTWADIYFANGLSVYRMISDVSADKYPKITALDKKVTEHPKIAEWIRTRPETPM